MASSKDPAPPSPPSSAAVGTTTTTTTPTVVDALFDAVDRSGDGLLDFGDVVYMLKRLSPEQSLESARNAAVEALLLMGRGEAAIAPPSAATSAARRLDRADFRVLLEKVAAMAGVNAAEAAEKLLAQARRSSFSLGGRGGGGEGAADDDAAVAREVEAVDRRDSALLLGDKEAGQAERGLVAAAADAAAAASGRADDEAEEEVRVLPSAEATAAAAAAVAASVAGAAYSSCQGGGGGGGGIGVGGAGGGGGGGGAGGGAAGAEGAMAAAAAGQGGQGRAATTTAATTATTTRRKALALATDPQLGLLFNAWCGGGNGGAGSGGGAGGENNNSNNNTATTSTSSPQKAMSLADVAQGLCRLRPPRTKEDVAAALSEAAHAVARHDADGDGLLARSEFAAFVSSLLSAAGVAFGDAAGALLEVAQARPASEAMRRTLEVHGGLAARALAEGRRTGREGGGQTQGADGSAGG